MPNFVQNIINEVFEIIWPEIEQELFFSLRLGLDTMEKFEPQKPSCCYCITKMRAFFLYTQFPLDGNIWRSMR